MNAIEKYRLKLHNFFLQKALQKAADTPHYSVVFDDAKEIGLLFDATEINFRQPVEKYAEKLRAKGKKVRLLAFYNEAQRQKNFTFYHLSKKDLDFALRPKDHQCKDFIQQQFDVLLNLYPKPNLTLEYISAFSKATFRVGPITSKTYCYDLMVQTRDRDDPHHFIQQVEFFLNKIQKQHEASAI